MKRQQPLNLDSLRTELKSISDDETAAVSQRFFKTAPGEYGEGDLFLGVRVPELRKLAKKCQAFSLQQTTILLHSKFHEERLLAVIIWVNQFKKASVEEKEAIYHAYLENTQYINNWDIVDISACHIVGGYLENKSIRPLKRLAKSDVLWERRIAIMASLYFIRKGEFEPTLVLSKMLLTDEHDLIHKAVGWMLREVGKRDLAVEEAFLRKYYLKMPRTMLRYAIERFPEKKRKGYLTGKVGF